MGAHIPIFIKQINIVLRNYYQLIGRFILAIVYFSHSYRPDDASFTEYFTDLILSENLTPRYDPPSERFNKAKMLRNLASCDGMVAILNKREVGGTPVSAYILFEINQCLKSGKPLLVFMEDVLDSNVISNRILQSRFSRRSFNQQIREHRHAIQILKNYLGDSSVPKYQPHTGKKICLLLGTASVPQPIEVVTKYVVEKFGYSAITITLSQPEADYRLYDVLTTGDLVIYFVDNETTGTKYLHGAIDWISLPVIAFTMNKEYSYLEKFPKEMQPQYFSDKDIEDFIIKLETGISVFEEDYLEVENEEKAYQYSHLLSKGPDQGIYPKGTRNVFIHNIGGNINIADNNAGIQGTVNSEEIEINNLWEKLGGDNKRDQLLDEIEKVRETLLKINSNEAKVLENHLKMTNDPTIKPDGKSIIKKIAKLGKCRPLAIDVASKIGANAFLLAIVSTINWQSLL